MIEIVILLLTAVAVSVGVAIYRKLSGENEKTDVKDVQNKMQEALIRLEAIEKNVREDFKTAREEQRSGSTELRKEVSGLLIDLSKMNQQSMTKQSEQQQAQLSHFAERMDLFTKTIDDKNEAIRVTVDAQLRLLSETTAESFRRQNEEIANNYSRFAGMLQEQAKMMSDSLHTFSGEIHKLTSGFQDSLGKIREGIETRLDTLSRSNSEKLEQMRQTVDEKLQDSIEKRFNESFKLISERLEQVHKGLGEMQNITTGMEDLKSVFRNVKARGIIGEAQLAGLLEQFLAPDQYLINAQIKKNSGERVEFAVRLPGQSSDEPVLLSIDAKFPLEDFNRIVTVTANTIAPQAEVDAVLKAFEGTIRSRAKEIRDKYIDVPVTVDFALMFVPSESIYSEVLRRPGLFESVQRDYKVTIVGPVNLAAFLSSLQMGFKTLAIQKHSSEVWKTLGVVKTEFGKFGDVLDKTKEKLEQAVKNIDQVGVRTRAIERSLKGVESTSVQGVLPEADGANEQE